MIHPTIAMKWSKCLQICEIGCNKEIKQLLYKSLGCFSCNLLKELVADLTSASKDDVQGKYVGVKNWDLGNRVALLHLPKWLEM